MKNLRRLACKFDLDQSERKSSQVNASARKPWPNGVASKAQFSTCVYLRLRLAKALNSGVTLLLNCAVEYVAFFAVYVDHHVYQS